MYGLIPVASAADLEKAQEADRAAEKAAADAQQSSAGVQSLAAHVRRRWELVANRSEIEERMAQCLRQRQGAYDPDKLAEIRKHGGSELFMMLTSAKCRTAASWLRDTLTGNGSEKPWSLAATPIPDLPPDVMQTLRERLTQQMADAYQMAVSSGQPLPDMGTVRAYVAGMRDQALDALREEARQRVERMEQKMEDQLIEGGFNAALSQFFDDLVTFPTAILKGPVLRKRKKLRWQGELLEPIEEIAIEWERVDPFKLYIAPWASTVDSGFVIERHKLTYADLEAMVGVEGYSDEALRAVMSEFSGGGLRNWLAVDSLQAEAEGKPSGSTQQDDLIEALQLWDTVTGKMLKEWGLVDGIDDETKPYPAEVWLIGGRVVRAVLNYDTLGRKPYYATSFERVPGSFYGNSVADLIRDSQAMCNAAARALSNNMGLASGPQVGVDVSRLPPGESISTMYPWKIWQFEAAEYSTGGGSAPINFFQPQSNAAELMAVFERFSQQADNDSGIPRYMQGEHAPGAGRTASGLSMMLDSAAKGLKQVVANIDEGVIQPLLTRLYQHNLRYSEDRDLVGDVTIQALGAKSIVARQTAMVRRNEFLQLALNSPIAQQIVGIPGVAELLRESAKQLDMPVDRVVPTREQLQQRVTQQQAIQQQAIQQQAEGAQQQAEGAQPPRGAPRAVLPDGTPAGGRDANLMVNRASGVNG